MGQSRHQQQQGCLSHSSFEKFANANAMSRCQGCRQVACKEHTFLSSMLPISSIIVMASAMIWRQPDNSGQVTVNGVYTITVFWTAVLGHTWRGPGEPKSLLQFAALPSGFAKLSADAHRCLKHPGIWFAGQGGTAHLAGVIVIGQAIDDRTSRKLSQLKNILVSKQTGHDHIIVPARQACSKMSIRQSRSWHTLCVQILAAPHAKQDQLRRLLQH